MKLYAIEFFDTLEQNWRPACCYPHFPQHLSALGNGTVTLSDGVRWLQGRGLPDEAIRIAPLPGVDVRPLAGSVLVE